MRHFLAYGNSDQASFRDPAVRGSMDYLTVPGTIAAYYPDATAAFVLSSELHYVIDPRTPLFQGRLETPRPSHVALAQWLGPSVSAQVARAVNTRVTLGSEFYTLPVVREVVVELVSRQRDYGGRAGTLQAKLGRYQLLLAQARREEVSPTPISIGPPPDFVLLPYFFSAGHDGWEAVNANIWEVASQVEQPEGLSPVIAATTPESLHHLLNSVPEGLSHTAFFWLDGFNERLSQTGLLQEVWAFVADQPAGRSLVNLYGGFFSICLSHAGLFGFSNGLGYSESRDWPELPATGAAPARYYVRSLHAHVTPAVAQLIVDLEPALRCDCPICAGAVSIIGLSYHALKAHFALARRWELDLVANQSKAAIVEMLRRDWQVFDRVISPRFPRGIAQPGSDHLLRWAEVLERH